MSHTKIQTGKAPAAVGPYSQAIGVGEMVFCSGQVGIDPTTGKFAGEDVPTQTRQVFANIKAVLAAAGTDLDHVVKTTVFLADMADFSAMNLVYASFFGEIPPARSTVAVKDLPLAALVEIEVIAVKS